MPACIVIVLHMIVSGLTALLKDIQSHVVFIANSSVCLSNVLSTSVMTVAAQVHTRPGSCLPACHRDALGGFAAAPVQQRSRAEQQQHAE